MQVFIENLIKLILPASDAEFLHNRIVKVLQSNISFVQYCDFLSIQNITFYITRFIVRSIDLALVFILVFVTIYSHAVKCKVKSYKNATFVPGE